MDIVPPSAVPEPPLSLSTLAGHGASYNLVPAKSLTAAQVKSRLYEAWPLLTNKVRIMKAAVQLLPRCHLIRPRAAWGL